MATRQRSPKETAHLEKLLDNIDHGEVSLIDPDADGPYNDVLNDLQGNILKGHDRDYASHIFLKFRTDDHDGQKIIEMIIERVSHALYHITTARRQYEETKLYRGHKVRGKVFVNFFITAQGYKQLGFDIDKHMNNGSDGFEESFVSGMAKSKNRLNDPNQDLAKWHEGSSEDIHAMILIADDDEDYLRRTELRIMNTILKAMKGDSFGGKELDKDIVLADVVTVQRGAVQRKNLQPIEWFGYRDGISNPEFLKQDPRRRDEVGDGSKWNSAAPLNLVLKPDPFGGEFGVGSYLVFRKLEQNVHSFNVQKKEIQRRLFPLGDSIDRTGALVLGRYSEGTPTTLTEPIADRKYETNVTNDFKYDDDPDPGIRCPLHAHIRIANPRGSSKEGVNNELKHRIVRRGITYDERAPDSIVDEDPRDNVGLFFMCFQRSIRDQFEYIQRLANGMDPDPRKNDQKVIGPVDPIIGQVKRDDPTSQKWPDQSGKKNPPQEFKDFPFTNVVTLKGGEYFFAPSISFLKNLKNLAKPKMTGLTTQKDDDVFRILAEKGL